MIIWLNITDVALLTQAARDLINRMNFPKETPDLKLLQALFNVETRIAEAARLNDQIS